MIHIETASGEYLYRSVIVSAVDEDECILGRHRCHVGQQCRNLIGGYECVVLCPSGFTQRDDGSCVGKSLASSPAAPLDVIGHPFCNSNSTI